MSFLFGMPVDFAYHLVCWFAAILAPLFGGLAAAAAIVVFTMLVRLALVPLSYYAARGERARGRLLPQVQELQRRHAKDPERLRRELKALQRAEGTTMYAGCLPLLLQLPFFSVMYRLFLSHSVAGAPNALLSHRLLAAPLGSWWLGGAGPLSAQGAVFAGLFVLLAVIGVAALRAARRTQARVRAQATAAAVPAATTVTGRAGRPSAPAATQAAATQAAATQTAATQTAAADRVVGLLSKVVPFGSLLMAAIVPLAAGLYLVTTAAWTLAERAAINRWSRFAQPR
jgi:YidC/Oxa1 family membrane protein insertase